MNVIKSIIFVLVLPGAVLFYVPCYLLSLNADLYFPKIGIFRFISLVPFSIGATIALWCLRDFIVLGKGTPAPIDPPKELVVQGLYRITRNPMYVGAGFILISEAIFFKSTLLLIYALIVWVMFHLFVVFYEEPTLKKKFGSSYETYIDSASRWLPGIKSLINVYKDNNS